MKKKYIVDGKVYEIPDNESEAFLKDFPHAKVSYNVAGKDYEIPHQEADAFETDMGLKKKDPTQSPSKSSAIASALPSQNDYSFDPLKHTGIVKQEHDNGQPLIQQETPKADIFNGMKVDAPLNGFVNNTNMIGHGKQTAKTPAPQRASILDNETHVPSDVKGLDAQIEYFKKQDANKGEGNLLGYFKNKVTDGVGSLSASAWDLMAQGLVKIPAFRGGLTEDEALKKMRDEEQGIRGATTELVGSKISPERQKGYEDNFVISTAGGLFNMAPVIGYPYGIGLAAQAYDHSLQEINSTENGKNLPESTKTIYALMTGIATGALMNANLNKIFGNVLVIG